jgi:hypothetical protein
MSRVVTTLFGSGGCSAVNDREKRGLPARAGRRARARDPKHGLSRSTIIFSHDEPVRTRRKTRWISTEPFLGGTSRIMLTDFIPDRACFSRRILAFSWSSRDLAQDRGSSEFALFSRGSALSKFRQLSLGRSASAPMVALVGAEPTSSLKAFGGIGFALRHRTRLTARPAPKRRSGRGLE